MNERYSATQRLAAYFIPPAFTAAGMLMGHMSVLESKPVWAFLAGTIFLAGWAAQAHVVKPERKS